MTVFDPLRTLAIGRTLVGMLRPAALFLCVLALSGCSYAYEVRVRVADGRLVFDANPQWGADCVRHVEVRAEDQDVGTVWEQSISHGDECANKFPTTYGEPLVGRPYVYGSGVPGAVVGAPARSVAAQKLRAGVIYTVSTTTGATGYGCGRFRIGSNRHVQNLGCS